MDLFLDINVSELNAKRDELSDERTKWVEIAVFLYMLNF
jgi:hypothetical protein